eukprot:CAMPEP_0201491408 /NCGR_PEP_ID=MMETSP0151_2-20130828/29730_1 /ASSEMBLY_ACC=CAM_ASM_000257 /TAXON_ID=200890 /ORGANISM="Paramoeba atlantica, Strain 621/1 / CCAP 1560/9" /LENGTH=288 /DNA_ID=CAMNT_0047877755 /DNA_START=30 /DNA_END=896 /DNA_ORIENTATION=-
MKEVFLFLLVGLFSFQAFAAQEPVDPSQWSYDTGYTYCMYAYAAYCPESSIGNWTCHWCQQNSTVSGFVTTKIVLNDGELVYLGYNSDYQQIVVSFRGSTDLVNWINNLDAVYTKYPYCSDCKVHKGFYDTWLSVKDDVLAEVWRLHNQFSTYSIVTTGHSLGGALSTLASSEVYTNTSSRVYSWTLGSPRVGNKDFSSWYHDESGVIHAQRITNWHDVVPHLPNEEQDPFDPFHHVPQECWEQKSGPEFILCDADNGEDPHCSDSVLIPDSVDDHLHYFGVYETCSG